jgi:DNA-binding Xre family transcriptional regulator
MTRRVGVRWNLRQVMATHGLYQTSDLLPLLADRDIHLSRQYVHTLVTKTPQRINTELLMALCDILDCDPGELLEPIVDVVDKAATASGDKGPGIGDLRPVRAVIRRPTS